MSSEVKRREPGKRVFPEIAEAVGLERPRVHEILALLLVLEPGSKTNRSANFEEEGFKPPIYNVWTFSKK